MVDPKTISFPCVLSKVINGGNDLGAVIVSMIPSMLPRAPYNQIVAQTILFSSIYATNKIYKMNVREVNLHLF